MQKAACFATVFMDVELVGPFAPASSIVAISLSVRGSVIKGVNRLIVGDK